MKTCGNVLLLAALATLSFGRRVPWWHLRMVQKQGPNTCAVEELPDRGRSIWTECKYWMHREVCGVKTVIRYDCCEGYQRVPGMSGCSGVKPIKNVLDTARDLGATRFVELIIQAGLSGKLPPPGSAATLFVPTNAAFEVPGVQPQLLYHVLGRKLTTREFLTTSDVESLHEQRKVRLNSYSSGVHTVNCVPLVRKDHQATDGIVHIIDRLLPPVDDATVAEVIVKDGRFRDLAKLLLDSGVATELRGPGPFTVFTPSDEAFQNILPSDLRRISADSEALRALVRHHIVRTAVCPPAVIDTHRLRTLAGTELELVCNVSGTFVNGAQVLDEVLMAGNGVVSLVGDVLVPDRVRTVLDLADRRRETLGTFLRLARLAGVDDDLSAPDINVTVFAPSNKAFEDLPATRLEELTSDLTEARRLLRHHTVDGKIRSEMFSGQNPMTLDGRTSVHLNVYRQAVGVDCAIVTQPDIEGQNGVLHIVDKVLLLPNVTLLELLRDNEEFSTFSDAVGKVLKTDPTFLSSPDNNQVYTVFVPNNEAFERSSSDLLRDIQEDPRRLKRVLKNHVATGMLATGAFRDDLLYDVQAGEDVLHVVKKGTQVLVNDAHIIKSDVLTKNGIVHCIDQVLLPAKNGDL